MEEQEEYGETKEDYPTIYEKAIIKWGVDSQVWMLIEEMSELTTALLHKNRGRVDNVAEEFADVEILMKQLRPVFNINKEVDQWCLLKMNRLEERINKFWFYKSMRRE